MQLEARIRRTLAIVQAAIDNPAEHPLREANARAAELLDELDPWTMQPTERREIAELTSALRTLRQVLACNDGG